MLTTGSKSMMFGGVLSQLVALVAYEDAVSICAERAEFGLGRCQVDGIVIVWVGGRNVVICCRAIGVIEAHKIHL